MITRIALGFILSIGALVAQPASTTFRPQLLESVATSYSYSSDESLERNGPAGSVAVHRYELSLSGRAALNDTDLFAYGLAYTTNSLDLAPGTPLPDQLSELSLNLGYTRKFSQQWSGSVFLRPGLYGDLEDIDGKTFNAPLLLTAAFAQSRELLWFFGLNLNAYSDNPVLPIVGVRWQFAPDWTFNVGFPRTGVSYKLSETVTLHGGLTFQGGTFRITESLGTPAGATSRLANTFVDYREIRVGVGADIKLHDRWSLNVDVGSMTDRKFDYFDRDYVLNGDAGFYGALSLKASF
ncbi:DUF6268 family outer membrane beta-barrel protein [Oleiharenicola lentus]|uniref:DUF6268 family outer membrane beta-barrel protein n=1 Tax=Oleiharenicola lentus TaxID=2508720 RepID=UPI003F66B46C